ncbi:trimethylamine methyltransferase family protein [Microbacterium sp. ARD31]|uniref:trimethylamine methyltransferase family protein n=1 Tax=Microbacterium sp. ARD31 TaxID=2962576 RepID=UPI002880CB8F|nr:trimethylamine methyltransferase family protein [Microbacterium sp. ARD31]MDT0183671.1 trimethylamine methyltransferase family protein [Microbacterium sp. ARD31]
MWNLVPHHEARSRVWLRSSVLRVAARPGPAPPELRQTRQTQEDPVFRNVMPRYEVLSQDAMATLDQGWRRLMTEIGVEFMDDRALDLFRAAGQKVEDRTVFLDPDFVLEQVAKAPREFDVQARNPEHSIHIGGDAMAFGAVYGPPFVREGEVRRDATMDDFRRFTQLAQSYPVLDSAGGVICEPNDTPLDSRHLDMTYALQTLTDKVYMGNVVSGVNAADTIAMTSILFGSREAIEETPATISLINCNSPLRWDDRMLEAQFEYSAAGQPVVLTPFILMGAMSPVTIPAALVQQIVEALSGIALSQLIRPGTPVIFGSFLSNIDMQSGSPTFGTPESGLGLLCTGQIARHFGLPFRTGGGLTSSQVADAQAGYEALMTLMPTFLAGANWVMHSAGWLEGGLVAGYEKFIVDIELLQMLRHEFTPLEIDEASMAFDAHQEVGHGGHFLGAMHTMERFRTCFYRPLLSSSENYERWMRNGGKDANERAAEAYQKTLADYEEPPLDDAIRQELQEYVIRRRAELGD